jgi:3',5'-cyclic-AMP phosphodiesterase
MKLLQVSDCHLVSPGETLFALDPAERLRLAIDDINRTHADADLCIFTGDLAHAGGVEAYAVLRDLLTSLSVPYRLVPGNHDDRETLREVFQEVEADANGYLQSVWTGSAGVALFLDTLDPGVHSGAYCATRALWLEDSLATAGDQPAYLFMHHPPMDIGMPRLDQYRILDATGLENIVRRHSNVHHIFFGHVHRPVSGAWHGIPFTSLPGTNHQNALDFAHARENISTLEPPAYSVILANPESTIVHSHAFADENPRYVYDPDAPVGQQIRVLE